MCVRVRACLRACVRVHVCERAGRFFRHVCTRVMCEWVCRFSADYLPATIERVSCKGKFIFMSCSSPAGQARCTRMHMHVHVQTATFPGTQMLASLCLHLP